LQRAWNKYGEESFQFDIVEYEGDRTEREKREQKLLNDLQPFGVRGFNNCRFVGVTTGIKLSDETKRKISAANLGRKNSEATLRKLSEKKQGKLNPQWGRPMNDRQRAALIKRGKDHPWYGRSHSYETKLKLSMDRGRPVEWIDDKGQKIGTFLSVKDAAIAMQLRGGETISRSAKSGSRKAAGFMWKYADISNSQMVN
jgi:group I intron endonuclease